MQCGCTVVESEQMSVFLTISDDMRPQSESRSRDPAHLPSDLDHPRSNSETDHTLHQQLQKLELKVEELEKLTKKKKNKKQLEGKSDENHPIREKSQVVKEKIKDKDESIDNSSQTECKYYMRTGGCKYGKACRFNHPREKASVAPVLELNFLGLPIRPGEKECPFYMHNGSCKYEANCKYNHPDPTAAGACDSAGYGDGGSVTSQVASQVGVASWLSLGMMNEAATYVPIMFPPPPQGVPSQNPGWNGFQASVDSPERSLCPSSGYVMNNPSTETSIYTHHQPPILVDEFPEQPGQPKCSYFMKTGDCKFKSNRKLHHPKDRIAKAPPCSQSDKSLPLRSVTQRENATAYAEQVPVAEGPHPPTGTPQQVPLEDPQNNVADSEIADSQIPLCQVVNPTTIIYSTPVRKLPVKRQKKKGEGCSATGVQQPRKRVKVKVVAKKNVTARQLQIRRPSTDPTNQYEQKQGKAKKTVTARQLQIRRPSTDPTNQYEQKQGKAKKTVTARQLQIRRPSTEPTNQCKQKQGKASKATFTGSGGQFVTARQLQAQVGQRKKDEKKDRKKIPEAALGGWDA